MENHVLLIVIVASVLALTLVSPAASHADVSVGARIGGDGFRDAASAQTGQTQWRACRMNGIGVFGEYKISDALFAEVGLDGYFVDNWIEPSDANANEWALDRTSILVTGAIGARGWRDKRISPNVHVGVGGEFTEVTLDGWSPIKKNAVKPVVFIGIGGDLNLSKKAALGMSLRLNSMTLFAPEAQTGGLSSERDFAAQMQFWAKYRL